jgi:hypothetical protein
MTDVELIEENVRLRAEISEAKNNVKYLHEQFNEINLLNNKVLCFVRLNKRHQLSRKTKLKILGELENANSVSQVKAVYLSQTHSSRRE